MTLPWHRRVVAVLGKGGVGRSTVARAVAVASASEGISVALVEVNGARALADACGVEPRQAPQTVSPGVDLLSLSAPGCLEEYTVDRLKVAPLARAVFRTQVMGSLLDGIPGMSDLLHHGKIESLIDPRRPAAYDRVVIDGPATGHGLQFLQTPDAMAEMTGRGPLYDEARQIADHLADPRHTAVIVVTLAEELPATEAIELVEGLGARREVVRAVVVNRVVENPLPAEIPWARLRAALAGPLVEVGDRLAGRLLAQSHALERLRVALKTIPVGTLPRLASPMGPANQLVDALIRGFTP